MWRASLRVSVDVDEVSSMLPSEHVEVQEWKAVVIESIEELDLDLQHCFIDQSSNKVVLACSVEVVE